MARTASPRRRPCRTAHTPPKPSRTSTSGTRGFSAKNTFLLKTSGPTITLDSLGVAPLHTATPTLTGVAAHNESITITVYPGDTTDSTPVATAKGNSGGDGRFSIGLRRLTDGRYTAIASDGSGRLSHPVTFRVKVHAPALTLTQPTPGGRLSELAPIFLGVAGTTLGDSPRISVTLFRGASTRTTNLGTSHATQANGTWSVEWSRRLTSATYTVRVSQADDAGHTTTITRTFQIVPASSVIGSTVTVSPTGQASVPVWCAASVAQTCTGSVLILTKKTYQTSSGGLAGHLRVMFAYVSIPGGATVTVKRQVQTDALRTLRRARKVTVVVVATLRTAGSAPRRVGVDRVITVQAARRR